MLLKIDQELKDLIPPLASEDRNGLENNIKANGCETPITVWDGTIIDGHNRYEICIANGIPFEIKEMHFADKDDAKVWMIKHELEWKGRKITPYIRSTLALKMENIIADKARNRNSITHTKQCKELIPVENSTPVSEINTVEEPFRKTKALLNELKTKLAEKEDKEIHTRKEVSKIAQVSENTIARVKKIEEKATPEIKKELEQGTKSINEVYKDIKKEERKEQQKQDIIKFSEQKPAEKPIDWIITDSQELVFCDALITDPPYGITKNDFDQIDLESFTKSWATKWNDCCADFFVIFWSQEHMWDGKKWFDECLSNYKFQQLLIWHYPNNKKPQSREMFKQTYEPIYFYRKKGSDKEVKNSGIIWGDGLNEFDCHVTATPQSNYNNEDCKQHPTQKPISVMKWLVNVLTKPNELICDPFSGSGTTGIAALQLGRKYHGIEINKEYIELSKMRLTKYGKPI